MFSREFIKLYAIMYRLTSIKYRQQMSKLVPDIQQYDDSQVFELAHAVNTGVDVSLLTNPHLSSERMREIRLDAEFAKSLDNGDCVDNMHVMTR